MGSKFGFLRETEEAAKKAGVDKNTGLHRTGLETYLKEIFPQVDDWVHDKTFEKEVREQFDLGLRRPDYRSEMLKLIVEFDGLQHYQKPDIILRDKETTTKYQKAGYKVVRIPYFIQLTNLAVKELFGVEVKKELFPDGIPSLSLGCYPADLCPMGIKRMAEEYRKFPEQFRVEKEAIKRETCNTSLIGWEYLEMF